VVSMKPEATDWTNHGERGAPAEAAEAGQREGSAESDGEEGAAVREGARVSSQHRNSQPRRGARGAGAGEDVEGEEGGGGAAVAGPGDGVAGGALAAAGAELECDAAADGGFDAVREGVIEREFAHHHPGVARLNNGSFGSAPRRVLDAQAEWNGRWLRHPDAFCWEPLSDGFLAAREGLAELIGRPDVEEVVLLENATTGAAIVALDCMWGFLEGKFAPGDAIVMFDSAYGAVKKCFQVNLAQLQ
jgi:hypothetical protein